MNIWTKIGIGFGVLVLLGASIRLIDPKGAERRDNEEKARAAEQKEVADARKAVYAKVSRDNFNRITLGMTYQEVCDILGPGKISSESRNGYGDDVMRVSWTGNGILTTINMTFKNGRVTTKTM